MRNNKSNKGFTLIELLIVVVVIGILAAIAIPRFSAVRERSFRSTLMSDLRNLASVQEVYYNAHHSYSTSLTDLGAALSEGTEIVVAEATSSGWAAVATHPGVVGEQCGVFHGSASPAGGDTATVEGVIDCSF